MAEVASLLLEIESAQRNSKQTAPVSSQSEPQFLGSLFDNDEEDEDMTKLNQTSSTHSPDLSLCITGKSCIIHPSNSDNNDGDLIAIKSVNNIDQILTDKHDARHKLSPFDMKDIESTQQRLSSNKSIYAKQWDEDKEWHLRDEKLSLIQHNASYTIESLQNERYRDLKEKIEDENNNKNTGKLDQQYHNK